MSDCVDCEAGRHGSTKELTDCTTCPIGWKQQNKQQKECLICQPGQYGGMSMDLNNHFGRLAMFGANNFILIRGQMTCMAVGLCTCASAIKVFGRERIIYFREAASLEQPIHSITYSFIIHSINTSNNRY